MCKCNALFIKMEILDLPASFQQTGVGSVVLWLGPCYGIPETQVLVLLLPLTYWGALSSPALCFSSSILKMVAVIPFVKHSGIY